jgi:hypothetical protein
MDDDPAHASSQDLGGGEQSDARLSGELRALSPFDRPVQQRSAVAELPEETSAELVVVEAV